MLRYSSYLQRRSIWCTPQTHQDSGRSPTDLGWVHLGQFHGCTLPTLEVGNRTAAWCETQWKMYVSWFWLHSGFSLFWGCSSPLPVLPCVERGMAPLFHPNLGVATRSYWLLQRVTWHWGTTAGRQICPKRLFGMGWTNILQKLFNCCWLCPGGKVVGLHDFSPCLLWTHKPLLQHFVIWNASIPFFWQVWR